MKLVKSLLLGSVAGIAAVAGAQAADLPVRKAAPVDYVRVCSTYGAGFFFIPGTETCLRVGGRVRAEFRYVEPLDRLDDSTGFRALGRINLDARTATAYGLLRTFVRVATEDRSGVYGNDIDTYLDQAFIQFGGLTAGRATSFFDNTDISGDWWTGLRFSDAPSVDLFAYTFSFGNGFSATISAEEGRGTRGVAAAFVAPGVVALVDAGDDLPDLVGNLKYTGTWGSMQLSGAVAQIRSDVLTVGPVGVIGTIPETEYGFAVSLQGGLNLPMLGTGDSLWFSATYADGALGYLGFGNTAGAGLARGIVSDAYINTLNGDIETADGWQIAGGFRHYWTPQLRQNIIGSYASVDYDAGAAVVDPVTGVTTGLVDFDEWRVGTNVIWSPVAGLDLGVEVFYTRIDTDGRFAANGRTFTSDDIWEGRIRVQRDF